jgi:hypothetical protein
MQRLHIGVIRMAGCISVDLTQLGNANGGQFPIPRPYPASEVTAAWNDITWFPRAARCICPRR